MIELKPTDLTEWDGFDVYDAETGENLCPYEVAKMSFPEDKVAISLAGEFSLSWDGMLYLMLDDGRYMSVPHNGKYLIQINGEKFMRW